MDRNKLHNKKGRKLNLYHRFQRAEFRRQKKKWGVNFRDSECKGKDQRENCEAHG